MNIRQFEKAAAQGDLYIVRVPDDTPIPEGAELAPAEQGQLILAHSETGHNHVMEAERVKLYKLPDSIMKCLLVVEGESELEHHRAWDTHDTIGFKPGKYNVHRQREYTPEGYRRVED